METTRRDLELTVSKILFFLERVAGGSVIIIFVCYSIGFTVISISLVRFLAPKGSFTTIASLFPYQVVLLEGIKTLIFPLAAIMPQIVAPTFLERLTHWPRRKAGAVAYRLLVLVLITVVLILMAHDLYEIPILLLLLPVSALCSIWFLDFIEEKKRQARWHGWYFGRPKKWKALVTIYLILMAYVVVIASFLGPPRFLEIRIVERSNKSPIYGYLIGQHGDFFYFINTNKEPQGIPVENVTAVVYLAPRQRSKKAYGVRVLQWLQKRLQGEEDQKAKLSGWSRSDLLNEGDNSHILKRGQLPYFEFLNKNRGQSLYFLAKIRE